MLHAAKILQRCELHIKKLPDFSLKDIENTIKYSINEWNARYIFFDYLHTSMKILSEVSSKTGIKGLREDNVLFMMSIRLKDICNEYGVFIMTATQLNADYISAQQYDQNLLRGAKSIADKIDLGMIMLQTSQEDKEALKPILANGYGWRNDNISIYKAFTHQHLAEIKQSLVQLQKDFDVDLNFIPVRGNFARGIFASVYTDCNLSLEEAQKLYNDFYADRIKAEIPKDSVEKAISDKIHHIIKF